MENFNIANACSLYVLTIINLHWSPGKGKAFLPFTNTNMVQICPFLLSCDLPKYTYLKYCCISIWHHFIVW